MCECLLPTSYDQLRASPPAFTTLTLTAPHQVTSQAGGPQWEPPPLPQNGLYWDRQFSPFQHLEYKRGSLFSID